MTRMSRNFGEDTLETISSFVGAFSFLDPYYNFIIPYMGQTYPSLMHAFIAARTGMREIQSKICRAYTRVELDHYDKTLIPSSPTWEIDKREIVRNLTAQKFTYNVNMAQRLVDTSPHRLVYVSENRFLGASSHLAGTGENYLGYAMTEVRRRLLYGETKVQGKTITPTKRSSIASNPDPPIRLVSVPEKVGVLLKDETVQLTGTLKLDYDEWEAYYNGCYYH